MNVDEAKAYLASALEDGKALLIEHCDVISVQAGATPESEHTPLSALIVEGRTGSADDLTLVLVAEPAYLLDMAKLLTQHAEHVQRVLKSGEN